MSFVGLLLSAWADSPWIRHNECGESYSCCLCLAGVQSLAEPYAHSYCLQEGVVLHLHGFALCPSPH